MDRIHPNQVQEVGAPSYFFFLFCRRIVPDKCNLWASKTAPSSVTLECVVGMFVTVPLHGTESSEASWIIHSFISTAAHSAKSGCFLFGSSVFFPPGRGQRVQIHRHAHKSSAVCVTGVESWRCVMWQSSHIILDIPELKTNHLAAERAARFLATSRRRRHRDQSIQAKVCGFYLAACERNQNVCSVVFFPERQQYMNSIGGVLFKLYLNWLMITSVIWNCLIQ